MVLISAAAVSYFFQIPQVCPKNHSLCVMLISDLFFTSGSVVQGWILILKRNPQTVALNNWLHIFENPQVYNLRQVLDCKTVTRFRLGAHTFSVNFVINFIATVLSVIYAYDVFPGGFLRKCTVGFCYVYHSVGFLIWIQRTTMIGTILRALQNGLGTQLACPKPSLKGFQSLVFVMQRNISLTMESVLAVVFGWVFVATVNLIFNIFLSIKYVDYDVSYVALLQLRIMLTVVTIVVILALCEKEINGKVSTFIVKMLL